MMYKAKVAVCSDIRTKHSTQSERRVEFLNAKPWWYVKKPLGFKGLIPVYETTLRHIPKHGTLDTRLRETFKSHSVYNLYSY